MHPKRVRLLQVQVWQHNWITPRFGAAFLLEFPKGTRQRVFPVSTCVPDFRLLFKESFGLVVMTKEPRCALEPQASKSLPPLVSCEQQRLRGIAKEIGIEAQRSAARMRLRNFDKSLHRR